MRKLSPHKIKRYGWISDIPDGRDLCRAPAPLTAQLPPSADLRSGFPPCYDQGQLGSCTANAIAGAIAYDQRKQGIAEFTPSRLFIYYNERVMEGTVGQDAGAQIRDGIKSVNVLGAPPETLWAYSDDTGRFKRKPSPKAFSEAKKHQALRYQRIPQDLHSLKATLAQGFPFVFGFAVYDSFESQEVAKTGNAPMPLHDEELLGGHAVLAVGYDDARNRFLMRNSWNTTWGQGGYFTLPYAYLTDRLLCDDFWQISVMEG